VSTYLESLGTSITKGIIVNSAVLQLARC